ncbi:2154_t:CDS:2 [Rhizophagus irregularis]|nr:2154_t:CDS:2 [Rhizophagus irregularis]
MLNGPSGEEKRNKIRCCRLHGEANSAPLETFLEEWRKLQDYTLNIFNANEAELFFRMASNQTLASAPTSGTKLDRTRITVLLATNAIEPRCLHRVNRNSLPCSYYVNSKAWMRSDIFSNASSHFNPDEHDNQAMNILMIT